MPPSPSAATRSDGDDDDHAPSSSNPPVTEISDSDMDIDDDDDDDDDQHEAAVEGEEDPEEEEVDGSDNYDEEEEEEEVVDEDDGEGEDNEKCNDISHDVESERPLGSHCTPQMSQLRGDSVCNFKCSDPSDEALITQKEKRYGDYAESRSPKLRKHLVVSRGNVTLESTVNKTDVKALRLNKRSKECSKAHGNRKVQLKNSEAVAIETTEPSTITGKDMDVPSARDCIGNAALYSKEELKPVDMKSEDTEEQTALRFSGLVASGVRTRSLSPSSELKNGTKRPTVICDFFAKGWCIKGSSCRFPHISNKVDNTNQQPGVDEVVTPENQLDEGSRNILGTPHLPSFPDPVASSIGKDETFSCHFSSERIPSWHKENPRLLQLDGKYKFSPFRREDLSLGISPDHKQFPSAKNDPGLFSSFKDVGIENLRQQWPATDHGSYSSLINRGSPFSFSSSFNNSLLGAQKLLDSDRASITSSLLQSASGLSGSVRENISTTGSSWDRLLHAEHKSKISSNDWEPSVPFQPSFFITPAILSSSGNQYDPLRDSFDLPNIGDKAFKFSFLSQETSISNASQQPIYGDSLSSQTGGTEHNGDKNAIPFQNKVHGSVLNKNCGTPGKDSFTTVTLSGGTGVALGENGIAPKEESATGTDYDKVSRNANKLDVCDARHQINETRHKKDLKADSARQSNEMEVDQKIDRDVQKEPKVLRHFRSALIDFVKELLKPTWREGNLSKDAHNTIVKKTVEKVLSTLQLHQIPATLESINLYLSASRPKMAKLVEGYIMKYGKS